MSGSIPAITAPNPVDLLTGAANAASQVYGVRQLQAQQAAGQDFQKSINPQTGQVDYGRFNALLGGDPRAAMFAQQASQQGLNNQSTQQANLQSEVKTYIDRHNVLAGIAYGWTQNPNLSRSDVIDDISNAISSGAISPQDGASVVAQFNPQDPKGFAQHEFGALLSQGGQFAQLYPQYGTIDQQSGLLITNRSAPFGTIDQVASVPYGLTPAQAASPVTIHTANGDVTMPFGQYAARAGGGNGQLLSGGDGGMGTGRAPQQGGAEAAQGQGMPPATQGAPASPQAGWNGFSYPDWAQPGQTFIRAGLPAEQKAGTDLYTADTNLLSNIANQQNQLQSIVAESAGANTGNLAQYFMDLGSTAQQLGLTNGQQATDLNLIQKNVSQLVASRMSSMGVPTDAKMQEAIYGTPNAKMTPDAIKGAAAQLYGAMQWKQAEMQAFQQYAANSQKNGYPVGAEAYAQFNAQWQQKVPVASFQIQQMPRALRAQFWKSLPESEQRRIYQGMQLIKQMGVSGG